MKKALLIIVSIFIFIPCTYAFDFKIGSDKVVVVNLNDDKILYEKNMHTKTSIASLTKIINAITVIDSGIDLDKEVKITSTMLSNLGGYAKAGYKKGDVTTIRELLYALINPSGADAAMALAITVGGNTDNFVKMMNDEVKKIGVSNSNFTNPYGKDNTNNYSTAYDMYVILKYCLQNKDFKEIFESSSYYVKAIDKSMDKTLDANAKYFGIDASIITGSKTGFTDGAGRCLASTSSYNNIDYLIINLNAVDGKSDYIMDPINLYKYYFDNYDYKTITNDGDILYSIKVNGGNIDKYNIISHEKIDKYLDKNFSLDKLKIEYSGVDEIDKTIKLGDRLGTIIFKYNEEKIYTLEVYMEQDINYFNILHAILIGCCIILVLLFVKKLIKRKA